MTMHGELSCPAREHEAPATSGRDSARRYIADAIGRHREAFGRRNETIGRHEGTFGRHRETFERRNPTFDRHDEAFERRRAAFVRHRRSFGRQVVSNERIPRAIDVLDRDQGRRSSFCRGLDRTIERRSISILRRMISSARVHPLIEPRNASSTTLEGFSVTRVALSMRHEGSSMMHETLSMTRKGLSLMQIHGIERDFD